MLNNGAEAQLDVRRTPSETREEILLRFKQIINDPAIEIAVAPGLQMPSTEPSSRTTVLYRSMERAIDRMYPHDIVTPYMSHGATDGSYLRSRGMAVYGVPIFVRDGADSSAHGNDERISPKNIEDGVDLLWQIVLEAAGGGA
jgi:acetylornithine deacetylase/succinyl-diaminopimelate desuccinylase-like protein